jgi:DNA-binding PadR family transcriptional regulator
MIPRELKAASSRPLILSILARGEGYGYQILQDILEISGGEWEWSEAMLYPVLHRLNSEGLIRSRWEVQKNGRKRKYYRLTADGRKALQVEKSNWLKVHLALARLWEGTNTTAVPT